MHVGVFLLAPPTGGVGGTQSLYATVGTEPCATRPRASLPAALISTGGLYEAAMVICMRTTRHIRPGEQLLLNYVAHIKDEAQRAAIRANPSGQVACRWARTRTGVLAN